MHVALHAVVLPIHYASGYKSLPRLPECCGDADGPGNNENQDGFEFLPGSQGQSGDLEYHVINLWSD